MSGKFARGAGGRPWRVGIDVGGTFTDGVAWSEETGALVTTKVLSTPDDPGRAFLTAAGRLAERTGAPVGSVSLLVHGTTLATNAVLQRHLAPTAFITTRGFGDLLEIARQVRPDPYDVFVEKPAALVPRRLCFEVDERISAEGEVVRPLDEAGVVAVADELAAAGVEAVAVCLLHAYRNPAHERRVAGVIRERLPGVALSISSGPGVRVPGVPPRLHGGDQRRLMPEVSRYLRRLDDELGFSDASGPRLVMQSNGGVSDFALSAERPVFMIESGPAAGAVAAAHVADRREGLRHPARECRHPGPRLERAGLPLCPDQGQAGRVDLGHRGPQDPRPGGRDLPRGVPSDRRQSRPDPLGRDLHRHADRRRRRARGRARGPARNFKMYEVGKNVARTGHVLAMLQLLVSEQIYAGLPDDVKQIVDQAAREAWLAQREAAQAGNVEAEAALEDLGVVFTDPPVAPFQEAVRPYWDEWGQRNDAADLVEAIRAMQT